MLLRRNIGAAVLTALVVIATAEIAEASHLTVKPLAASPGQSVSVLARGFDSKELVQVLIGRRTVASVRAGSSGRVAATFALPDRRPTRRAVIAIKGSDRVLRRRFEILDDPLIVAAGDVACAPALLESATSCAQARVARAITKLRPDAVAPLGDIQYETGALVDFNSAYDKSWGAFNNKVRPAVGNHEYGTPAAAGYFQYFGKRAGSNGFGYYSYDLGTWHVIVLNSNCTIVACDAGSQQYRWLVADLKSSRSRCTLAYWHHPLFSSGTHGGIASTRPFWDALNAGRADVVLNGHDHLYERFAPQDPSGTKNLTRGIREFVVGTGGRSHYPASVVMANSEVRNSIDFGALAMTLRNRAYSWQFVSENNTITDSGTNACH